ncbi:patatin-like phospholipase family protein [Sulfurovum sp. zt1-1]|uniref:Patatin-like phospholipase family protein n=1 Tax=Sulfurovum zhangzhouensis TaxID=3019067 RepID=A0ABT7QWL0_9BACT|nr:patatin-like phospholipase family protein [Sulfurovum zhangzhouensis]MDM5270924.1 patatin-like phospholipase family protein [Sulfurovum zhangzhouensis]
MKTKGKVSLVLGSGGARGYAHIGVIEELEKRGYEIVSISGASMGALIGGLYASGKLDTYKKWILGLDPLDVASLVDFSFNSSGLIKGDKVFDKIAEMIGKEQTFETLPIEFTAVATDVVRKKEVWFQSGNLLQALRASIAIPTIFTPVKINDMILTDGGILNPLPVAPTMSDISDLTIAVNLYADIPKPTIEISDAEKKQTNTFSQVFLELLEKFSPEKEELNMFDILDKTFDTMQNGLTRYRLGGYPPDILIEISKDVCNTYDFHKSLEVIEQGRIAAKHQLDAKGL